MRTLAVGGPADGTYIYTPAPFQEWCYQAKAGDEGFTYVRLQINFRRGYGWSIYTPRGMTIGEALQKIITAYEHHSH